MALNRVSTFFGLNRTKQQVKHSAADEDEDLPKAPVRKYSLSKTGRMRAKQYTHKTITDGKLYQTPDTIQETGNGHKRNKSQDSNAGERKKDEEEDNIDNLIGSLYDFTKTV